MNKEVINLLRNLDTLGVDQLRHVFTCNRSDGIKTAVSALSSLDLTGRIAIFHEMAGVLVDFQALPSLVDCWQGNCGFSRDNISFLSHLRPMTAEIRSLSLLFFFSGTETRFRHVLFSGLLTSSVEEVDKAIMRVLINYIGTHADNADNLKLRAFTDKARLYLSGR